MQTKAFALLCALAGVALFAAADGPAARAQVIQGVTIEDVSSQLNTASGTNFRRDAIHVIDGSGGPPVTSATGTHSNVPEDFMWLTTGTGAAGGPADPHVAAADGRLGHIVFDLGDLYDVTGFHLWNYNEAPGFNARAANAVTVSVSQTNTLTGLNATGAGITTLASPTNFTQAPGSNDYAGEDYAAAFTARYVRFDIASSYNGDNSFTGLSEIRFLGTVVPEPSAAALALGAAAAMTCVRRRRRSVR